VLQVNRLVPQTKLTLAIHVKKYEGTIPMSLIPESTGYQMAMEEQYKYTVA